MRDLMVFSGMLFLVPFALRHSFISFLIWGWTSAIAIDCYLYGFMQSARLNLLFALLTIIMLILKPDPEGGTWNINRTLILLVMFLLQATLSAIFAYPGNIQNWELYEKIVKTLIFVFMLPLFINSRLRIHLMILILCFGISFHGVIDGAKFFLSGGGHIVRGIPKFGDNNLFAVYLIMVVPLLLYVANYAVNRRVALGAIATALLTIGAIIGTRSRGGLISIVITGLWIAMTSRRKLISIVVLIFGLSVAVAFTPASWTERMQTIETADADASFMQRVEAWQVSSAIALKNPFLGGGIHAIETQSVWEKFRGQKGLLEAIDTGFVSERFRAAHSIYFEVMGDLGFSGFLIFIAILLSTIINSFQIQQLAARSRTNLNWATDLSKALTAVIVTFCIGGAAVAVAYSESLYTIVMLMEILKQQVAKTVAAQDGASGKETRVVLQQKPQSINAATWRQR